jgi:hypothetical protein
MSYFKQGQVAQVRSIEISTAYRFFAVADHKGAIPTKYTSIYSHYERER